MTSDQPGVSELARARVLHLASIGVPFDDIRALTGTQPDGTVLGTDDFKQAYAHELRVGYAQANVEVSKALFEQASNGKSATVTLAWAKHKLGWGDTQSQEEPSHDARAHSAHALAALQQLLDQLAGAKASGSPVAAELADCGPAGATAPGE